MGNIHKSNKNETVRKQTKSQNKHIALIKFMGESGATFPHLCCRKCIYHYANVFVQYTAIFHGCKNDNFQIFFFYIIFLFYVLEQK